MLHFQSTPVSWIYDRTPCEFRSPAWLILRREVSVQAQHQSQTSATRRYRRANAAQHHARAGHPGERRQTPLAAAPAGLALPKRFTVDKRRFMSACASGEQTRREGVEAGPLPLNPERARGCHEVPQLHIKYTLTGWFDSSFSGLFDPAGVVTNKVRLCSD